MLRSGLVVLLLVSLGVCLVNGEYPRRPRPPQPRPGDEWVPDAYGSTPRPRLPGGKRPDGMTGPPRRPDGTRPDGMTGPPRRPDGTRPDGMTPRPHHPDERKPDGRPSRPREFPGREIVKHRGNCRNPEACQHWCVPLPSDFFFCTCKRRFILGEDGKSCVKARREGEAPWDRPDFGGGVTSSPGADDDDEEIWWEEEKHREGDDENTWPEDDDNSIEGKSHRERHGHREGETKKRNLFVGLAVAFGTLVVLALVLAVVMCCICKRRRLSRHHGASSTVSVTSDPPAYDSISVRSQDGEVKAATATKTFPLLEKAENKRAPSNVYVALPLETKAKY